MLFSLIITFRNEGEQVYKTCSSFLKHCNNDLFEIIVINDASDDRFDYSNLASLHNVKYIENKDRMGVAGSRDLGAINATGKYILILDGHMRVFEDVLTRAADIISNYPEETLFCFQSIPIQQNLEGKYTICKNPTSKGCKIYSNPNNLDFLDYEWQGLNPEELGEILPIQCVMGACYLISREYYLRLHGLNGLQQYGMDEQLLSAKVFMSGGNIYLFKNIGIAHFYRRDNNSVPYKNISLVRFLNKLIILYLLDLDYFNSYSTMFINEDIYNVLLELKPYLEKERTYLQLILTKRTFKDFLNYGI